jgi:hypothetical protein
MSTTEQDEQRDKLQTLLQDADVRRQQQAQGSTMHQFAQQETLPQGLFSAPGAISTPNVIGAKPGVAAQYPAASAAHQTELPPEKPLGYACHGRSSARW